MKTSSARAAVALSVIAAVTVAGSAHAATRKPTKPKKYVHTKSFKYSNPCGATLQSSAGYGPGGSYCPPDYQLTTAATDRYMSVTVADATGQAVPVTFIEDGTNDAWTIVCGSSHNESISPNDTYDLNPVLSIGDTCPVSATQGTVTIKVSNYPL